jgi:hypothetical protein
MWLRNYTQSLVRCLQLGFTFTDTHTHTYIYIHVQQFRFLNNTKCNPNHLNCQGNPRLSNFLFISSVGDPPKQISDLFYCVPEVASFIPKHVPTIFWLHNELCHSFTVSVCPLLRRVLSHTSVRKVKAVKEDRDNFISLDKY